MAESKKMMRVEITRFDPDRDEVPKIQEYEIPVRSDWKVLDAINYIKDEVDPTVSHRWSCRMAVCGSCGMMLNGEPKLTCKTPLSDYDSAIKIEPLANFPIVRDLVVDMDGFMDKFRKVKPWIVRAKERAEDMEDFNEKGTFSQSPAQLATFKQFSMCINCLLCYAACPVIANEPEFIGPAAIALGHRYNIDSRDEGARARNAVFRGEGTVFSCSFANECSEVCPKNVDPAAAVNQAKLAAVVDWAKGLILPREGA
ncbi:MAG TPA: succinate dehydrogenase iron-sulfur subunit [Myxococcales bacterium]|nr:succinate dehydrogenase iron-sulfur subunit [Myxococcales bacterium]HIL80180.1 succinate dehydrogenase iron-sulfur subunit [Myxococcales bacterium]